MAICFSWNEPTLPRRVTSPWLTSTESRLRLMRFVSASCVEMRFASKQSTLANGARTAIIFDSFFLFSIQQAQASSPVRLIFTGVRGPSLIYEHLQSSLARFARANANGIGDLVNEDLPVANLARLGRFDDR